MAHIRKARQGGSDAEYVLMDAGVWTKLSPNTVEPKRESLPDIGFTIAAVERCDGKTEDEIGRANFFTTQLSMRAPQFYHFELIPHPDLDRAGYSFLNSPKLIRDDEEIIIPLVKNDGEDIQLPYNVGILVLRENEHCILRMEVASNKMATNSRNMYQQAPAQYYEMPQPVPVVSSRGGKSKASRGKTNIDM